MWRGDDRRRGGEPSERSRGLRGAEDLRLCLSFGLRVRLRGERPRARDFLDDELLRELPDPLELREELGAFEVRPCGRKVGVW